MVAHSELVIGVSCAGAASLMWVFQDYAWEGRRVSLWYTSKSEISPLIIPARIKVTINAAKPTLLANHGHRRRFPNGLDFALCVHQQHAD